MEFTAFGPDGTRIAFPKNPAGYSLQSQRQLARVGSEIFGVGSSALQAGWVQLNTDNPEIGSLFQFGGPSSLDGSVPFSQQSTKLYFTRVFE